MREHSKSLQSGADDTGVGEILTIAGSSTIAVQVFGTFVGTVTFQGMIADTWVNLMLLNMSTLVGTVTAAAGGLFIGTIAGLKGFRANITAYTSGNISVVAVASEGG